MADEQINRWMDRQMGGWVDEWMDGWYGQMEIYIPEESIMKGVKGVEIKKKQEHTIHDHTN